VSSRNTVPSTETLVARGFAPRPDGTVDLLLVFPPTTVADRYGKASVGKSGGDLPPLGVTSIAAYLRREGFGVGLLDGCALGLSVEDIVRIVAERRPRAIGLSATTYALPRSVELAKALRGRFPDLLILLGGAHANAVPKHAMEAYEGCFDLVIHGEGEHTAKHILDAFAAKGHDRKTLLADTAALSSIQGLVFRSSEGLVQTKTPAGIQDLDSLPAPARDLLPHERYIPLPNQYKLTPLAHMVVIRGCPYFCSFCDQANTGGRMHSPKRAVEDIQALVRDYGIKEVSFWDDTMSFNKHWMKEFCQRLIAAKTGVIWSCYAAVRTLDQPTLKHMADAGCWNIFFGIETSHPTLLRNIEGDRKNGDADRIRKVIRWTKEAGIEIRGSFMIALPGETPEMAEETIRFAKELDPEYAQFSITTPYPGTKLYDEIKAGKWGKLTTEDFSEFQGWNVVFLPEGYKSKDEVWAMEKRAFRSFYFRPSYMWKMLKRTRRLEDVKRYVKGVRLLLGGFAYGPMPAKIRAATDRN